MTRFRLVAVSVGSGIAMVLSGCGNGPPSTSSAAGPPPGKGGAALGAATVTVQGTDQDQFAPKTSSLKVGDIIEWDNGGAHVHNVTFDDYQPLSGDLGPGAKWQVKFDKAGEYDYHCTFHPAMTAKLTVG